MRLRALFRRAVENRVKIAVAVAVQVGFLGALYLVVALVAFAVSGVKSRSFHPEIRCSASGQPNCLATFRGTVVGRAPGEYAEVVVEYDDARRRAQVDFHGDGERAFAPGNRVQVQLWDGVVVALRDRTENVHRTTAWREPFPPDMRYLATISAAGIGFALLLVSPWLLSSGGRRELRDVLADA